MDGRFGIAGVAMRGATGGNCAGPFRIRGNLRLAFVRKLVNFVALMSRFPLFSRLMVLALLCVAAPSVHAQINVSLEIPRRLFICYEPIIATVKITNLTGRDLTLADAEPNKWFSFEILNSTGDPVPPIAPNYHLQPLTIPMGQTVRRKVNLVNLYPVTDYGVYHIKAVVYFPQMDKFFTSDPVPIEVTEGQLLWSQKVGIPDGQANAGQYRTFSLLSFRHEDNILYVRIEDEGAGVVYGTYPLGRLIDGYPPEAQVDLLSQLHILQMIQPKEYLYTRVGADGSILGQQDYTDLKTRPRLDRNADGDVAVGGGIEVLPKAPEQADAAGPKLSDRPAGLPETQ